MNSRKSVCKLAGFLVAVEVITSCVVARADSVKFSGYLQAEILRETGEGSNKTEGRVRRARIKMRVKPVDIASVTIQGDFTKKDVSVKDAYADIYFTRGMKLRAGQFKVPFSSQLYDESSSVRLSPERAIINRRLFPGERDRGFMLESTLVSSKVSSVLSLGVFSGAGPGVSDNNNDKDFAVSLLIPAAPVSLRLSAYNGRFTNPSTFLSGARVQKVRYNIDAVYNKDRWNLQVQCGWGNGDQPQQDRATDTGVRGGYGQVAYKATPGVTLFTRYQYYDPDTAFDADDIDGGAFGLAYQPNSHVRYTAACERLDDSSLVGSEDIITLRVMVRY